MIAIATVMVAAATACDFGGVLRAAGVSSLPPQTARNVAAKVRWAEAVCRVRSIAPVKAQDELRVARDWAHADKSVTRAIDGAIYDVDHAADVPARLTIRVGRDARQYTIDGITVEKSLEPLTVQLAAGSHEISVLTTDLRVASTKVTLAEGEQRSITLEPREEPRNEFFVLPREELVTSQGLAHLCITAYHSNNGVGASLAELENVTIEKRGVYDVTDLFTITGGNACAADTAPLREVLGEGGPFTIRVRARTRAGEKVDASWMMTYGHKIVLHGRVPDNVAKVMYGGRGQSVVSCQGGRFQIEVPEGRVDLWAMSNDRHTLYVRGADLHCDAEVNLLPDKLEVVSGGCAGTAPADWQPALNAETWLEDVQSVAFVVSDGRLTPRVRYATRTRPLEVDEDHWDDNPHQGVLQVRAYSENGTLVYRNVARYTPPSQVGDVISTGEVHIDLPIIARTIVIKGWAPEFSGRFEIAEIEPLK